MSDTDSIQTDRSQSDLQQRYDRLAMEFAKARMQLNVLKKAYTAKTSQLNPRSVESLDKLENCKFDSVSTKSLDLQKDFNKQSQVNEAKKLKSNDVKLLHQEISTMNHYIRRVLESTKSNTFDYNFLMSEIDHCKSFQNNCVSDSYTSLNNDITALKCSVSTCLYNILYQKLEARNKINMEDTSLINPENCCFGNNYESEDVYNKIYLTLIFNFFASFVLNVHGVLKCLLREIHPDACLILKNKINALTNQTPSNSLILETVLTYCEGLNTFKFGTKNILIENILLFISHKYKELVKCLKNCMDSESFEQIDFVLLRQIIISFMSLKFPIAELVESGELQTSNNISKELNGVMSTIHSLLRIINMWEFESLYKISQLGMHWHMKNPLLHIKNANQAKEELKSVSLSEHCSGKMVHLYKNKLNQEINRSLSLEQEKIHWENEFWLLSRKNKNITDNDNKSSEAVIIKNQLGKCESRTHLNGEEISRENQVIHYFKTKINNLLCTNKELSSQNNAHEIEIIALQTQLDHSILVRNDLEIKLKDASEYIEDLKDEFHLTSTNYENQLRAMTEHLASLNETVELERKHIDDLNKSKLLKTKPPMKSSK